MQVSHDRLDYEEFIKTKHIKPQFQPVPNIDAVELNHNLKDFQADIVMKALRAGRYAIFADCGMGKTFMQLEWARVVRDNTGGRVLILAPLAVIEQTKEEAAQWGISLDSFTIVNYERLEEINPEDYTAVVLDESSILKNFTGKTKRLLIDMFQHTPYRLCCTATPSPNDHMELGNHCQFLGVMSSNEMLSRFFINSTEDLGKYRLKGHAERSFWEWVCSWAVSIKQPSDLGYSDEGYILPPLEFIEHDVKVESTETDGMFEEIEKKDVNATQYHQTLRESMAERLEVAKRIAESEPEKSWIIWVRQNEESNRMAKMIPDAVEVVGSEKPEVKAAKFKAFKEGKIRVLITKESIAQFGLNFQHCDRQIFCALGFGFEGFYQAVRRSYRFGQPNPVQVHIIKPSNMTNVAETIERKRHDFVKMQTEMAAATKRVLNPNSLAMFDKPERRVAKTDKYEIILGDSVDECAKMPDNSVDLMVFSPPFSSLYIYSESARDMGNCANHEEFGRHFGYLCNDLHRILKPGRLVAMHVKQLAVYKNSSGYSGIYNFRGDCIRIMEEVGFKLHSETTIWNDPVFEMQRTKTQRLLYKQLKKDARATGLGLADYLILFRKWEGLDDNDPDQLPIEHTPEDIPLDIWQEWASPVWMNINKMGVLNEKMARDDRDEKHICPLQLDVIQRCVRLWSNPGELVFSPFAGIGSEGYQAILEGRRFLGVELKESYFDQAVKHLNEAVMQTAQLSLLSVA